MMQLPSWLLNETATVEKRKDFSERVPVYDTPFDIKCQTEYKQRVIMTKEGKEIASSLTLVAQHIDVPNESKVTINGKTFLVIETRLKKYLGRDIFVEMLLQ